MNETVFNSVYFPICNLQVSWLTPDETFSYAKRASYYFTSGKLSTTSIQSI